MSYRLRESPEDFRVEEVPAYAPTGEGDHTFVRIEKRLRTTPQVASALARAAGCPARDVGYAGRKDRGAVAVQWFSVPKLDPEAALALELEGAQVLEAARHPHKLRTGQLRANRFELRVLGVARADGDAAIAGLAEAAAQGFPNRFGEQRFGRDGDNAERAAEILATGRSTGDRREARFLVSALQSAVFNRVLDERPLPLDRLEVGDVAVKHESGGLFDVEDAERESERGDRFEISATGPLFGTRMRRAGGAPGEREAAALAAFGLDLDRLRAPRGIRLRGARRALRARPDDASGEWQGDALCLRFSLGPGSYATVLVAHLLGPESAPAPSGDL